MLRPALPLRRPPIDQGEARGSMGASRSSDPHGREPGDLEAWRELFAHGGPRTILRWIEEGDPLRLEPRCQRFLEANPACSKPTG
jgi:hypothetical protein